MNHDSEKAAAAYLAGEMNRKRRAAFERHIVECTECWQEVRLGQTGRSLAEGARDLAPQSVRERVRATVDSIQEPRRRVRLGMGAAALAIVTVLAMSIVYVSWPDRPQPRTIDAVLTDFRDSVGGSWVKPRLPFRLGDLAYRSSYRLQVEGKPLVVHAYEDPAGHEVVVYRSNRTFPFAVDARHSADGRTWTARDDGVVMYCADDPVPSLVVGDDAREVKLAVSELGLR